MHCGRVTTRSRLNGMCRPRARWAAPGSLAPPLSGSRFALVVDTGSASTGPYRRRRRGRHGSCPRRQRPILRPRRRRRGRRALCPWRPRMREWRDLHGRRRERRDGRASACAASACAASEAPPPARACVSAAVAVRVKPGTHRPGAPRRHGGRRRPLRGDRAHSARRGHRRLERWRSASPGVRVVGSMSHNGRPQIGRT